MEHKGTIKLETNRLILRRFELSDAKNMFKNWATDEETTKYLTWNPHKSIAETTEYIAGVITCYSVEEHYQWVIELVKTNEIIGNVSLHDISNRDSRVELGYCLGSKWWNRGYMTESVGEIIRFSFESLGAHKVVAKYDEENVASGKVMMKNHMVYEGRLRKHTLRKSGKYGDILCYGLLREEYYNLTNN